MATDPQYLLKAGFYNPITGAPINPDAAAKTILGGALLGFAQIANATLASSSSLSSPPAAATVVWLQAVGQNVICKPDGGTATTTNGFTIYSGQPPVMLACNPANLRFIRAADGATLNVIYYG